MSSGHEKLLDLQKIGQLNLHFYHRKRNVMLYDGDLVEDEPLVAELIAVAKELHAAVTAWKWTGDANN